MTEKITDKDTKNKVEKTGFPELKPIHKAACIALVASAALIAICLVTDGMGVVGNGIRTILRGLFSMGSMVIPIALIAQAIAFADDLKSHGFVKRTAFAAVSTVLVSCIEYAISTWSLTPEFYPTEAFASMSDGGLIGNTVGYLLSTAFNPIGAIIIAVMALAIYSVFFFAEKAGSLGQAAINFANAIKAVFTLIKDKHSANVEKKRRIKEDAEQHQREAVSEELIDDEFFRAKGSASEVRIRKLGIEENASTHGLSPLTDSEKPIVEEPVVVVSEPEVKRKRSDKPLDLTYGITEEPTPVEEPEKEKAEKPASDKFSFGLDDSADSVFTRDFDPFDFATSEKRAAKYASRVSTSPAVTEELDDMAIYEMKANHEPDERERRLMELERKKQEWLRKKGVSPATDTAPAPSASIRQETVVEAARPEPVHAEPLRSEPAVMHTPTTPSHEPAVSHAPTTPSHEPAVSHAPTIPSHEPAKSASEHSENTASSIATSSAPASFRSTGASRQEPILTFEFTVSKSPDSSSVAAAKSAPVATPAEKPAETKKSDDDIAIIISERVAKANPGYARSANDLKTYTKVVTDGDEELYRQLEGISSTEPTPTESASEASTFRPAVETVSIPTAPTPEPVTTPETVIVPERITPVAETVAPVTETNTPIVSSVAPTVVESTPAVEISAPVVQVSTPVVENLTERSYTETSAGVEPESYAQKAPETVTVTESVPEKLEAPEFKPYTPPTESIQAPTAVAVSEDSKLKVERSMLPPTPEAIATPTVTEATAAEAATTDETTPVTEQPVVCETTYTSAPVKEAVTVNPTVAAGSSNDEIDFTPVDTDSGIKTEDNTEGENDTASEPLFDEIDTEEANNTQPDEDEDDHTVEISFDDDDEDGEEDDGDTSDYTPEEEEYDEADGEIPPEEQNPDVIRMRGMFNCLDPIENKTTSAPAMEERAEITVASEADEEEPPFDDAVEVKPYAEEKAQTTIATPVATDTVPAVTASQPTAALVPVSEKKPEKKKADYSDYQFPDLDFLAKEKDGQDENIQAEIQENADKLIETLASFGVTASIKGVDRGPRITRYEVVPAKGVKVSSILGLQDDIALNLAAGSIRMEAPIPGKSAVGIEIPNKNSSIVRLRDLIETPEFQSAKSKTQVCIGRDVAGQPVFGDLAKMPHLLIAGATGMGKSVCINSLLISILYKAKPDEVKFIMIDPKQVEFTMYNGIPHLLVPVVSDAKQAAGAIMWAVDEMDRRYNLLNSVCSKSVDSYNDKVTADPSLGDPLPKIIIVIDEFADLMLQVKDPVEQLVTRIAQKARAAGIHLVIGTQRPSVNVITGVIKANVPSRISCKVMSNVDSKTVLDSAGAEKLLDKGDALYAPAGSPKPHRLQCAYVDEAEVEVIMDCLKKKSDGASYDSSVMEDIERAAQKCSKKGDRDDGDRDEGSGEGFLNDRQFLDAVEIAVNTRKISTSLIQRKMSIGYGKAAKFIDIMEDMGIVGPANGQRPREVLLSPDDWREKLARLSID
ncbi:MAG: DNA translocase FtsK 4TM domain-containing protein [Clostridia bacterium]|nr:DNA translocase FtsK 4TM domain-containing protein [Clostridia bacterium]